MTRDAFCTKFPVLYHLTSPDAWVSIAERGLISTAEICRVVGLSEKETEDILTTHRPESRLIHSFLLRHQKPLVMSKLATCLHRPGVVPCRRECNLTPQDWLRLLNSRIFFHTDSSFLQLMRSADSSESVGIITVKSSDLLSQYEDSIELSHINLGATRMPDHYRCRCTLQTIEEFPIKAHLSPKELTLSVPVLNISKMATFETHTFSGS